MTNENLDSETDSGSLNGEIPSISKRDLGLSKNNAKAGMEKNQGTVLNNVHEENADNFQQPKKGARIPPIVVSELNTDFNYKKLRERLQQILKHSDFMLRCLFNKKIKIQTYSIPDFRAVQMLLRKQNVYFHTNLPRMELPFKYIMKGVHPPSILVDEITYELDNMGFIVDKVTKMKRQDRTNMHMAFCSYRSIKKTKRYLK